MSDGISVLEELAREFGFVPVAMVVVGGLTYGFCAGESLVKSAYQKRNGDSRSFKELYHANFLNATSS